MNDTMGYGTKVHIEWLEKSLRAILDCCDLKNAFMLSADDTAFANDIKEIAQSSLDRESTTDTHLKEKQGLEEERDMLADENKQMAEYLIYLHECNKIDLERDNLGWLL